MSKYLDSEGLAVLWNKINTIFMTEEDIDTAINALVDGAPTDYNTLKKIADKISSSEAMIPMTTEDIDDICTNN